MGILVEHGRKPRLIVLLPGSLAGDMELARKVFWIAVRDHREVFYLALVDHAEQMLAVTQGMSMMKTVTAGNFLVVQSKFTQTAEWIKTLRGVYQPGDRILCLEEQAVSIGLFNSMPASLYLHQQMDAPVITISGFSHPQPVQIRSWLKSLAVWLGFLVILACFSLLEIQLDGFFHTGFGKIGLFLIVTVEIGAMWAWNQISGS